jgi:cystathionine beta-lyase
VIIQPPIYHPFRIVPEKMKREVVYNPLKVVKGKYEMDFENLESVIDKDCKVLILSNPHNPAGIVWGKETLQKLAEICHKHGIIVISDEIHSELAFPEHTHHPFATVSDDARDCSITFMAPSKTFNIAGIVSSYSIIPNDKLRNEFYEFMESGEFNSGTIFAYVATEAAYTNGAEWLKQMRSYVIENVRFVDEYLKANIPQIKVYQPQASFLVWLDCRELGLSQKELVSLFQDKAGLLLNDGSMFGKEGVGFMRLNVGCPRSTLEKALKQLKKAIGD